MNIITILGVKGWLVSELAKHFCHTTAEIHPSAVELVHRDNVDVFHSNEFLKRM